MTSALDTILERSAASGEVPGVVAMVGNRDGVLYEGAFGLRRSGEDAPMTADTVAWIASMTKAITTAALLQLVEEGKVALDAPAADYAPGIGASGLLHDFDAEGQPLTRPPARPVTPASGMPPDIDLPQTQRSGSTPQRSTTARSSMRCQAKRRFSSGNRWKKS